MRCETEKNTIELELNELSILYMKQGMQIVSCSKKHVTGRHENIEIQLVKRATHDYFKAAAANESCK